MSQYFKQQPDDPSARTAQHTALQETKPTRPGWPELLVGLLVWTIAVFVLSPQLSLLELDPATHGLIMTALSGIVGAAAFSLAYLLRIKSGTAFGVRRTTRRWLVIGLGVGIGTLIVKSLASGAYIVITGDSSNPQATYAQGASGGVFYLVAATVFLGVITPFGEELLFRGVVANTLVKYGPFIGVGGSALIFALFHGINPVFPAALVIGLITAELFRRSGSIWPGVVVHIVCNLPAPLISVAAGMG